MEKEYAQCQYGFTANCPHVDEECMKNLRPSPQSPTKYFNDNDIDSANKLCQNCIKFTPFKNQSLKD